MLLSTARQIQTSRSVGNLNPEGSQKVATRTSSSRDPNHLMPSPFTKEDSPEGHSNFFMSDSSFRGQHRYPLYCSDGTSEGYPSENVVVDEESERIWGLFWSPDEDSPLQSVMKCVEKSSHRYEAQDAKLRVDDRFFLPSLVLDTHSDFDSSSYRSDAIRTPEYNHEPSPPPTPPVASKKFFTSPPPTPPPKDQSINYSHPQHSSWPTNTCFNTTPALRTRAGTAPSQSRTHRPSKLSICKYNGYPPRTSSIGADDNQIYIQSPPLSSTFPTHDEDFAQKMHTSVFDWGSDDEGEDERGDLPDWIRKLSPKRGYSQKDLLSRDTTALMGKPKKKKSKSFGTLGDVLKRSLRIRRSENFDR